MKVPQQIKKILPALPIGLVAMAAAVAASNATPKSGGVSASVTPNASVQTGALSDTPAADVTVNGQPVDASDGHTVKLDTPGGTAQVTVDEQNSNTNSSPSHTTTSTNPDGTMNIEVSSNSSSGRSRTTVNVRGGGSTTVRDDSSVSVHLSGTGSASATK